MSLPIAALLIPSRLMSYGPCYRSALLSAWLLCAATAPAWAADNAADTIRQAIQAGNLEQAENWCAKSGSGRRMTFSCASSTA
jgi:hypothetical protein